MKCDSFKTILITKVEVTLLSQSRFTDKSVVITGAAAGMGKQIATAFAEEGATVIAVDRDRNALETFLKELEEVPGRILPFVGDIAEQETNESMIDLAIRETGKIDILVNNAGIAGHSEPITETTNESWEQILAVDLTGPMYAIRKAVEEMCKQENGGSIVTIASVAGIKGCRSSVAYTVAKHGLIGLCEHTAYAYMHKKIRSNIVCPGAIRTGMSSNPEAESAFGSQRIWSGMDSDLPIGYPTDIANAVLFLSDENSKFINGATLVVDGGVSCN